MYNRHLGYISTSQNGCYNRMKCVDLPLANCTASFLYYSRKEMLIGRPLIASLPASENYKGKSVPSGQLRRRLEIMLEVGDANRITVYGPHHVSNK